MQILTKRDQIFKIIAIFFFFSTMFFLSACGANLKVETLSIGILNTTYSENLTGVDNSWDWDLWDNDSYTYNVTRGSLPDGLYITSEGQIVGTPTEVGNFEFRVTFYAFENNYFSEDDVTQDSEWFTLFITEDSTNTDCPSATNESIEETYLCLGTISEETLSQDDTFDLDVNFYVNLDEGKNYDITSMTFKIYYDSEYFAFDDNSLNSTALREAATRSDGTVSFSKPEDGVIEVTVTSGEESFHKPGRLMDLEVTVLQDVPVETYGFVLEVVSITGEGEKSLPAYYEVDGNVEVTVGSEELAESEV